MGRGSCLWGEGGGQVGVQLRTLHLDAYLDLLYSLFSSEFNTAHAYSLKSP